MKKIILLLCILTLLIVVQACEEFVQIEPPRTELVRASVFESDATALAAMTDIYFQAGINGYAGGGIYSVTLLASLSADEVINGITYDQNYQQVNENEILPANTLATYIWRDMYSCIYKCNAILDGVQNSERLSTPVKQQLTGEAKFFRAFSYFYLVNIFGDIPIVLTTDYKVTKDAGRESTATVYQQIVADLLEAQGLLLSDYSFSAGSRIRVNKPGITAFLARVYLYMQDWSNAEAMATTVIGDPNFSLTDLDGVFLKNSKEAILQFYPPSDGYANDALTFLGYGFSLRGELVSSFESGDNRSGAWVENGVYSSDNYPVKYYSLDGDFSEYSVVLRLAEQYLIRAEARLKMNRIVEARADVNTIRARAGLGNTPVVSAEEVMDAILQERRVELFTEWGHRWFDLKRTGGVDGALNDIKSDWVPTDGLYPIPEVQLNNSLGMAQNPGY